MDLDPFLPDPRRLLLAWGAAVLLLGTLGPRENGEPWRWRRDLPWALLAGVGLAACCAWGPGRFAVERGYTASDFQGVCQTLIAVRYPQLWHDSDLLQRNPIALLPAAWLRPWLGVLGSLAVSGLAAACVMGASLYTWGRALDGRTAGVLAALLVWTQPALAGMARHLTAYPVVAATFTLSAALATVAVRWPGRWTALLAGCGIGLAALVDEGGIIPALVALGVVAVRLARGRGRILRLAALGAPVLASWLVAGVLPRPARSLEWRVRVLLADSLEDPSLVDPGQERPGRPSSRAGFRWGETPIRDLPDTLRQLAELGRRLPPLDAPATWRTRNRERLIRPWVPLWTAWMLAAVLALMRRPWLLFAALVLSVPFLSGLRSAWSLQTDMRFLLLGLPPICIAGGVGTRWLAGLLPSWWAVARRLPATGTAAVVGGLLIGVGGSRWMEGAADGPLPFDPQPDVIWMFERARELAPPARLPIDPVEMCVAALARDAHAGRPAYDRILPSPPRPWPR